MIADSLFPYMWWAQESSWRSPYCLSQSGMPAPDAALLGDALPLDLSHPGAEALPALEQRLAELYGVGPERIVVSLGASCAMLLAALRWFPEAHVVTEIPSYAVLRTLAARFGASSALVERRAADGFALDLERVASLASDAPGRAHLFLTTPHNPTGVVTTADELVQLAEIAAARDGILISNEVYMEFARTDERFHAFALAPNAVSIGSLTKAYGLGALRIGWLVLGEGLAHEKERLVDVAYTAYVDPPTIALRAGRRALDSLEPLLARVRTWHAESRPLLERWLAECELVEGALGPLGLHAFPRVLGVDDTAGLVELLQREHGVDVVPGEFFGAPGHVRVGWGVPPATLSAGLERLEAGMRAFRSGA